MKIVNHRVTTARQVESPNQDQRPDGEMSLVVIHCISLPKGNYGGQEVEQLFCNCLDTRREGLQDLEGLTVSSHLLVRRDGELVQFVPFHRRAWHAGQSEYKDRSRCNDFSIGIELEGTDDSPFEEAQYQTLGRVLTELKSHYPIEDVVGHADIASARKTDPGVCFDWARIPEAMKC